MKVATGTGEEESARPGQNGVAQVTVQERHCARLNSALEAIAHDQIEARSELFHEWFEVAEIVAVIRVPHDDVFASGRLYPAEERAAIAFLRHFDDPGACPGGDLR